MIEYDNYSVPSTAKKIADFLSEDAFTRIPGPSNLVVLEEKLPDLIKTTYIGALDDMERITLNDGRMTDKSINIRSTVLKPNFIERIEELTSTLKRIKTTRRCNNDDYQILSRYGEIFWALEKLVTGREKQLMERRDKQEATATLTDGSRDQALCDKSGQDVAHLNRVIEYDKAQLDLVQSLKVGIGHLFDSLALEIAKDKSKEGKGRGANA